MFVWSFIPASSRLRSMTSSTTVLAFDCVNTQLRTINEVLSFRTPHSPFRISSHILLNVINQRVNHLDVYFLRPVCILRKGCPDLHIALAGHLAAILSGEPDYFEAS